MAGVGRDRRAIRYSYPGQGNRSLLGKTRQRWGGLFIFRGGAATAAAVGRERGERGRGGVADEWKPPLGVEGKFAVLRSGLRGLGEESGEERIPAADRDPL